MTRDELVSEIGRCTSGEALLDLVADRLPVDRDAALDALSDLAIMVGLQADDWLISGWLDEHPTRPAPPAPEREEGDEEEDDEDEGPEPLTLTAREGVCLGFDLDGVPPGWRV